MNPKTLNKLLKIVAITIVISFTIDKVVFFALNKVSDEVMTGQAVGKLNHFLSVKDTSDFLVFGNSRANRHIDVDLLAQNGFNIGIDGTGIAYISTLINTLDKTKEQFVLVHIDTKDFFKKGYNAKDIKALRIKYHRDEQITKALKESGHASILQDVFYSINYNGNAIGILKNYFRPSYNFQSYNGYDPIEVSKEQEEARDIVLNTKVNADCLEQLKPNEIAVNYLKDIKVYLESSNKKFLFITSPIYDDVCGTDNKALNKLMQELELPYIDYSYYYKTKNNTFWKDRKHMTKQGAEDFSKFLNEQLEQL